MILRKMLIFFLNHTFSHRYLPKSLNRERIAKWYLKGDGIEIGALNSPLTIPESAKVRYVDRMSVSELMTHYPLKEKSLVPVDIIDTGERLETITDFTLDFVVANHFLEHCQNPIEAVVNMLRVLKGDGILFMAIPDKEYTFDKDRLPTSLSHLLKDYEEGPACSKREHFREWVTEVEKVKEAKEVEKRMTLLMASDYSIHFHAWTQSEMMELLVILKKQFHLPFLIELIFKYGHEVIFILKKIAS